MYNDPHCRAWRSNKWAPPGFTTRAEMIQARQETEPKEPLGGEESREEKASYSHHSHVDNEKVPAPEQAPPV